MYPLDLLLQYPIASIAIVASVFFLVWAAAARAGRSQKRSTIRMLHIPFSLVRDRPIDAQLLAHLRRRYYLPAHLAPVLDGKRFRTPADILRDPEVRAAAAPLELLKLTVPPRYDLPKVQAAEDVVAVQALRPADTTLVVERYTLADGKYRLAISSTEAELISIALRDDEVDPATMRIGGFWWWEWPKLERATKALVYHRINNERVNAELLKLARIPADQQPRVEGVTLPIRRVAQAALFFNGVTGTHSTSVVGGEPGPDIYDPNGMTPEEYPGSNQCTGSPDWPFGDCCVSHDYCYVENANGDNARGCDDCARLQCDLDFLNCMLRIAGPNPVLQEMAFLYFMGVRAFGDVGDDTFQYCEGSNAGGFNLNKIIVIAGGIVAIGAALNLTIGGDPLAGAGVMAVAALVMAGIGKLLCEFCGQLEEWIEQCEEDRLKREKSCARKKKKCKKKKGFWGWAKKAWCYVSWFFECVVLEYIIRGLCALVKVVHPVLC